MTASKRILFVDDEVRVRESLQRLVRPFADQWDCEFAPDGASALEVLDRGRFDVVVTDMSMPGLDGSELLRRVAAQHPTIVRIVLATVAEQPRVMACREYVHQFITRPVGQRELHAAITRACDVEVALRREQIERLVARIDRLPSLPDIYHQMVEKMNDPESSLDEIGELIGRDISMTARILKLVNSAFFGLRYQVSSPTEAVNYLGLDTIKALVLSINAFAQFEGKALGGIALETLWTHSLATAAQAKVIAQAEGANARVLDEVFVAGMLHDTGKLILGANFASDYAAVMATVAESGKSLTLVEEARFGANHAEIGGYLLGLWGLPRGIVEAVTWHHAPQSCPGEAGFSPLACVHVANAFVGEGQEDETAGGRGPLLDAEYLESIGFADHLPKWKRLCSESAAGA